MNLKHRCFMRDRWKKNLLLDAATTILTFYLYAIAACTLIAITGCPEVEQMMAPVISEPADTTPPTMVGEVKEPETPVTEPAESDDEVSEEVPVPEEPEVPGEPVPSDDEVVDPEETAEDPETLNTDVDDEEPMLPVEPETPVIDPEIPEEPEPVEPDSIESVREAARAEFEPYGFSEETTERLVEMRVQNKKRVDRIRSGEISIEEDSEILRQLVQTGYGLSSSYSITLRAIYVEERPEEEYLLGGSLFESTGIAYLTVKEANPDAEGEEFEELFRQAARDGTIAIEPLPWNTPE